eukprot:1032293-Pelagomonas_calceolata.AAC.3
MGGQLRIRAILYGEQLKRHYIYKQKKGSSLKIRSPRVNKAEGIKWLCCDKIVCCDKRVPCWASYKDNSLRDATDTGAG